MRFLTSLGHDLRITVDAKTHRRRGRMIVEAA
jgi:hypothetical protein